MGDIATRTTAIGAPLLPLVGFLRETGVLDEPSGPETNDFAFGNPHDMPVEAFVEAYHRHLDPQRPDWFAYTRTDPAAAEVVAASLRGITGLDWDPADVFITDGDFAALAIVFRLLLDPGDEVVFMSPPWFFYETLIAAAGGRAVRVDLEPPDFDLPIAAIEAAITARTRAVVVNSPQNPTGRVYGEEELRALGTALENASERIGRTIYLVSDEPYRRVVFDGRTAPSPSAVYPPTFVTYSYGKVLLAPGERIGYIAIPPTFPDREEVRDNVGVWQFAMGWAFASATLQRAIGDLERLSIDMERLQRRRDRLVGAMRDMGYESTLPEGTFYILVRSPDPDDIAFARTLARRDTLVLPGTIASLPGWFRLSVTASDEMVERGLPVFETALAEARLVAR
jgi:aspartate aminotransferase